jgi:hypothetical protein
MDQHPQLEELFAGRHFDREVILLCERWFSRRLTVPQRLARSIIHASCTLN